MNKILLSGSKGFLGSKFDHSKYTGSKFFFAKNYKELRILCKKRKFEFLIHFGSSNRSTSTAEEVILKNIDPGLHVESMSYHLRQSSL